MPAELALTDAPHVLWRVERADPPSRFAQLNPVDALNDRAGNRFDVPGAGVLYAASVAEGAFAETLAQFRPTASVGAALAEAVPELGRVLPGQVPRAWLQSRRLRSLELPGALPFVDVEAPQTHTYLTQHAPEVVTRNGLLNLDVATVRGPSRRLTRDLAAAITTSNSSSEPCSATSPFHQGGSLG